MGYTGGADKQPTYPKVCTGNTGHAEAVDVYYDPKVLTYEKLLEEFFVIHRPVNDQTSFKGGQYRSSVFFHSKDEEKIASQVKARLEKKFNQKLYTEIKPAQSFYEAEEYHQDYYKKNWH